MNEEMLVKATISELNDLLQERDKEIDKYKAKEKELREFILNTQWFLDYKDHNDIPILELKMLLDILDRKDK